MGYHVGRGFTPLLQSLAACVPLGRKRRAKQKARYGIYLRFDGGGGRRRRGVKPLPTRSFPIGKQIYISQILHLHRHILLLLLMILTCNSRHNRLKFFQPYRYRKFCNPLCMLCGKACTFLDTALAYNEEHDNHNC